MLELGFREGSRWVTRPTASLVLCTRHFEWSKTSARGRSSPSPLVRGTRSWGQSVEVALGRSGSTLGAWEGPRRSKTRSLART